MTRDAKLFTLDDKGYEDLATSIESNKQQNLKDQVSIYQLHPDGQDAKWYVILSVSEVADKIIKDYGAKEMVNDGMIDSLKQYTYPLVYGNESVKGHLPKDVNKDHDEVKENT